MDQAAAFEKLSHCLHQAQEAPNLEQSRTLIAEALQCVERLSKAVLTAAEKRGRKGGTKTAERGDQSTSTRLPLCARLLAVADRVNKPSSPIPGVFGQSANILFFEHPIMNHRPCSDYA